MDFWIVTSGTCALSQVPWFFRLHFQTLLLLSEADANG
jgi:hypothetical protein